MIPAFLSVKNAPRSFIVFRPFAETLMVIFLLSSGMKRVFFCKFTCRRRLPVGLNFVARTRLEYPPPTCDFFPVMSHTLPIRGAHTILCSLDCQRKAACLLSRGDSERNEHECSFPSPACRRAGTQRAKIFTGLRICKNLS